MPKLSEILRNNVEGYEQTDRPTPVAIDTHRADRLNRSIRCPLPPFNAGPDTLRQFNEDGSTPHRRVIPLPVQQGGGAVTINQTNTTVVQQGGSVSPVSVPLAIKTATFTSGLLAPGNGESATIPMSKSFQLISCSVSGPAEFRLYGDASAQAADSTRPTDSPVPAEILNNLVTNLVFDTAPFVWQWQNRVGTNSQNPQTSNAYITVINSSAILQAITVSIVYLPLET